MFGWHFSVSAANINTKTSKNRNMGVKKNLKKYVRDPEKTDSGA
jgi:hypothetical protein